MINHLALMSDEFFLAELDRILEDIAYDINFTTPELCKLLAMSRTSLHRKIAQHAGKSISIYVREFRLRKANELLSEGGGSVSKVAYKVGFSDLAYFSKCFKAYYGMAPSKVSENTD